MKARFIPCFIFIFFTNSWLLGADSTFENGMNPSSPTPEGVNTADGSGIAAPFDLP